MAFPEEDKTLDRFYFSYTRGIFVNFRVSESNLHRSDWRYMSYEEAVKIWGRSNGAFVRNGHFNTSTSENLLHDKFRFWVLKHHLMEFIETMGLWDNHDIGNLQYAEKQTGYVVFINIYEYISVIG